MTVVHSQLEHVADVSLACQGGLGYYPVLTHLP
jgi:hypothetical protein